VFDAPLAAYCLAATAIHLTSCALAIRRCRPVAIPMMPPEGGPAVSIVRPVCGLDTFDEITLRSGFELDYPNYELIFCCARADDPAAALIACLMSRYPRVAARLLLGNHVVSANPKLNNVVKGWRAANSEWIILADSNVLMPTDYVQRLLATWRFDTGIVCAPPIGCYPRGFWAQLECAFLNTYQARWQYAADAVGFGFAQGKTMLWRRHDLDRSGGIQALGAEIAEDAAATRIVRGLGLRAVLVDAPFGQPLGRRSARQVWDRQARWSRLRRMTFPGYFAFEIFTGCVLPLAAAACVSDMVELPPATAVAALATLWLGSEALVAYKARWHISLLSPLAWVLRDVLLPLLWMQAWVRDSFSWRGSQVRDEGGKVQTT
jgi:ceramide glucosyltransferase